MQFLFLAQPNKKSHVSNSPLFSQIDHSWFTFLVKFLFGVHRCATQIDARNQLVQLTHRGRTIEPREAARPPISWI